MEKQHNTLGFIFIDGRVYGPNGLDSEGYNYLGLNRDGYNRNGSKQLSIFDSKTNVDKRS